MAQDTTQLIATARSFLASMAYSADERPVLVAIVDQLERTHAALSAIMEHVHVPTLGQTNRADDDALNSHLPEHVRGARRCGISVQHGCRASSSAGRLATITRMQKARGRIGSSSPTPYSQPMP